MRHPSRLDNLKECSLQQTGEHVMQDQERGRIWGREALWPQLRLRRNGFYGQCVSKVVDSYTEVRGDMAEKDAIDEGF